MNDLPEGWARQTLKEIADVNPRHAQSLDPTLKVSFVPMSAVSETSWRLNVVEQRELGEVRKAYTHFAEGDVLFAKITPCMENGKAAVALGLTNGLGCGTTELHVLRPVSGVEPKYVYYFLHQSSFRQEAARNFSGTAGQLRVPLPFVEGSTIPLAPLSEQRRIVAKLEEVLGNLDACQERLAKIPVILKRFRQSVLAAACSGQLTQDLVDSRKSAPWIETTLNAIASEIRTGPFGSALHKSDYIEGGVPVVNPIHIVSGRIVPSRRTSVSKSTYKRLEDYALKEGDIVIARRGEMGRCAVVTSSEAGWLCGTGSAILRLNKKASPQFVQLLISSPSIRSYLSDGSVGSTMDNLNQRLFGAMPISLPNVVEQREIVRRVEELFKRTLRIEARYKTAQAQVDKLTQSILSKAFRGELVPTEAELAGREHCDSKPA